jgi:hypothetical protein
MLIRLHRLRTSLHSLLVSQAEKLPVEKRGSYLAGNYERVVGTLKKVDIEGIGLGGGSEATGGAARFASEVAWWKEEERKV